MKNNFYQILDFPFHNSKNGSLIAFQNLSTHERDALPIDIKRILVIKDAKNDDVRGGHTHHKTRQILFAINGTCTVTLDNGKEKATVSLETFSRGVLLEPYVWHTMENFEPHTILLVLANTEYNEEDYIRSYDEFLKYIK
jgi:dTDP-4-dehydrorhamnose 3,5-epimerase-like enzyme